MAKNAKEHLRAKDLVPAAEAEETKTSRQDEASGLVPYSSLSRTERYTVIINGGARYVLGRVWGVGAEGDDLDSRPEAVAKALVRDSLSLS